MTESITIEFEPTKRSIKVRVSEYNVPTIDPEIIIQALYDLARDEEKSWLRWCKKTEMEDVLQNRRN